MRKRISFLALLLVFGAIFGVSVRGAEIDNSIQQSGNIAVEIGPGPMTVTKV